MVSHSGWTVPETATGERLDRHVADRLGVARNQVQKWIASGAVLLDGEPAKRSVRVAEGDEIQVSPPQPDAADLEPEAGPIELLYEDECLLMLNKSAGLVVHPGPGHRTGTLVHRLLATYPELREVGAPDRPGIVHRLDRDTTGAMVVARTGSAHRFLSQAFARRQVDKVYLAVAWGEPPERFQIDARIARHPARRQRMTTTLRGGRKARSRVRRLATTGATSLLGVEILTGRTHQIRVHLKHAGYPLLGDPVYGERRWRQLPTELQEIAKGFERPALHAWRLTVPHPMRPEPVTATAPPPPDLMSLWRDLSGEELRAPARLY